MGLEGLGIGLQILAGARAGGGRLSHCIVWATAEQMGSQVALCISDSSRTERSVLSPLEEHSHLLFFGGPCLVMGFEGLDSVFLLNEVRADTPGRLSHFGAVLGANTVVEDGLML